MKPTETSRRPMRAGDKMELPGVGMCTVQRVRPLGTVDVESDRTGNWFRVTGLPLNPEPVKR